MTVATTCLCPWCKRPALPGAERCAGCGSELATVLCSRCGSANARSSPMCSSCFADLRTADCPGCGEPIAQGARMCDRCMVQLARPPARPPYGAITASIALVVAYWSSLCYLFAPGAAPARPDLPAAALLAVVCGSAAPVLASCALWFGWGRRHMAGVAVLAALGSGAALAVPLSLLLTVAVPVVAIGFGAVLALPVIVGTAEELAKAVAALWAGRRGRYAAPVDGLVTGLLVGLGFAAVENAAYLARAGAMDGLAGLREAFLWRLASTAAHASWAGSMCYMLWRERRVTVQLTRPVLATFVVVSLLHAVWDYGLLAPSTRPAVGGVIASALLTVPVLAFCIVGACRRPHPPPDTQPSVARGRR